MSQSLLDVHVTGWSLEISLNLLLALVLLLIPLLWFFGRKKWGWFSGADVQLEIKLGGYGKATIKPNYEVQQIAHKAWVELKTRKAGLPIDKENDVISDIYDSWYALFKEIRTLARDVPASKLKNKDTSKLVELLIDSLNKGLRPHLTRWRAKYSRWYQKAVEKSEFDDLTPQDIQSKYPKYQELVDDMLVINKELVQYTEQLKKLI